MDKNTYETYEYLPSSTAEAEPDQFLVVQDDGTFLLNRQVQYVAQVQDVKEVLEEVQPCTVYGVGVTSQQFYVENSNELISVSDQFILPPGESSLYSNSYLLQSSSSNATEEIKDVVEQFEQPKIQEPNMDDATPSNKQENNFTEITLSDDQYQTWEQKGWILLEANNKTYVLNTLGLHDITTNDKLIQKLRNEIESDPNEAESGHICVSRNTKTENVKQELPNLVGQSFTNQQDTVELIIGSNEEQDDNIENLQFIITDKENTNDLRAFDSGEQMELCDNSEELKSNIINEVATVKQELLKDRGSIVIKTKYIFKDIPEKIVLGKTVNGKRLVAKVIKTVTNEEKQNIVEKTVDQQEPENHQDNHNNGISETELLSLIQQSVRTGSQKKLKPEDVKSAENVIAPLLKVPNLKNSLVDHDLIITKVRNNKDEYGEIFSRGKVTLLTGHVKEKEDSAVFEFLPDLLQTIRTNSEDSVTDENQHIECIDNEKEICTIFHVHITETKGADKFVRVSVALNKRQLSISQMFDLKKRQPSKVFACSACATLYKSEAALKEHQENDCLDADEMLIVDTNKIDMVDAYSIIREDKDKNFSCTQCNATFPKLYTCVRHAKTHFGLHPTKAEIENEKETSNESVEVKKQKKTNKEVYKCKMCASTYFHPATLSKHIMTRHIKVKSK